MKKIQIKLRVWIALLSTWIINLGMFGVRFKGIHCPAYSCNGCPWGTFACPVGGSAYQTSLGKFPAHAISFLILTGVTIGRIVCGFLCPFGLFQDIIHKIPAKRYKLPNWTRKIKYAVLILLVFLFPWFMGFTLSGYLKLNKVTVTKTDETVQAAVEVQNISQEKIEAPSIKFVFKHEKYLRSHTETFDHITLMPNQSVVLPPVTFPEGIPQQAVVSITSAQSLPQQNVPIPYLYFCRVCPVGTLTASIPAILTTTGVKPSIFQWQNIRLLLLLLLVIAMVFISRPFCQSLCPLGAFYALLNKFTLFRINFEKEKCVKCGLCSKICPMDLDVPNEVGGPECIACGDCTKACRKKALSRKLFVWK